MENSSSEAGVLPPPVRRSWGTGLRPLFVAQITAAARAHGIGIAWQSDYWVATLSKDGAVRRIIGYVFPLNDASAAQIANDKVATYVVLSGHGVAAVPHAIVRFPPAQPAHWPDLAAGLEWLPVVVKPHKESGGTDVHRARTREEAAVILGTLAQRYRAVTLSPYLEIECEYRVIVLDDEVKLIFRKVRGSAQPPEGPLPPEGPQPAAGSLLPAGSGEWRHNLRLGARPEVVDEQDEASQLAPLARAAMSALGLRFASVDVVLSAGKLIVLEVNSAVTMEHFSASTPACERLAADVYSQAVSRCFEPVPVSAAVPGT